jgi:hypothetical protein
MQRRAVNCAPEDFDMAAYQFWHPGEYVAWPQAGDRLGDADLAPSVADREAARRRTRGRRPKPKGG